MKKQLLFTIIFSIASVLTVEAQLEKGKFFLAGTNQLGFDIGSEQQKLNGDKVDNSKESYFDFNFTPQFGYTVIDNLVVGGFMDIDFYRSKSEDEEYGGNSAGSTFVIGPSLRYYLDVCDKMVPFVGGGVGFGVDNSKTKTGADSDWSKYNESVFEYWIGGGGTYFFNDMIGLDASIGFYHESYTHKMDQSEASRADDKYKYVYNGVAASIGLVILLTH